MKIPQEYLKESNYDGTRLVEVTDKKVAELHAKLTELQREANPHLEIMEKITPQLDPLFTELRELETKKQAVKDKMAPIREPYDTELAMVEKIDQRAQLIKNKIQPLILDLVKKDLGEFETARQLIEKDGKLYVEVIDELEEKVKLIRTKNKK